MMRLIDGDVLYKKTVEWEAEAQHMVEKTRDEDKDELLRWLTILGERTAFKYDVMASPAVDAVSVVRCKDCKHRIINEHFGERGYMNIKAVCALDTGDPFELGRMAEDDDWYCADGERKGGDE